ncbi:MAG: hypothetical protein AAB803_02700 [Patescibacteria group bacterium]
MHWRAFLSRFFSLPIAICAPTMSAIEATILPNGERPRGPDELTFGDIHIFSGDAVTWDGLLVNAILKELGLEQRGIKHRVIVDPNTEDILATTVGTLAQAIAKARIIKDKRNSVS